MQTAAAEQAAVARADKLDVQMSVLYDKAFAVEQAARTTQATERCIQSIKCISPREVCNILASLTSAISRSGWAHSEDAQTALEYIIDAHTVMEDAADKEA